MAVKTPLESTVAALEWAENAAPAPHVTVAVFDGLDDEGRFIVRLPDRADALAAMSTVPLGAPDAGIGVVVAFDGGDTNRPIILGRALERMAPAPRTVRLDGERLVLRADREIELRCGDASLVLTRAGKVLIKGAYVLSRSRGANKIKGAYVDIN